MCLDRSLQSVSFKLWSLYWLIIPTKIILFRTDYNFLHNQISKIMEHLFIAHSCCTCTLSAPLAFTLLTFLPLTLVQPLTRCTHIIQAAALLRRSNAILFLGNDTGWLTFRNSAAQRGLINGNFTSFLAFKKKIYFLPGRAGVLVGTINGGTIVIIRSKT